MSQGDQWMCDELASKIQQKRFKIIATQLLKHINQMRMNRYVQIVRQCSDFECLAQVLPAYNDLMLHTDKLLTTAHYQFLQCINYPVSQNRLISEAKCYTYFQYILKYELRSLNLDNRPEKDLPPLFVAEHKKASPATKQQIRAQYINSKTL